MSKIDLSILIVNWNVKDYLRDCLNSIYEKTRGITFEIIVIDNASSDGSVEMVSREFPEVRLVASPNNLGFGRANNLALPLTEGRYIGLLNPDTILVNDAFAIMVQRLTEDSNVGIVGPQLLARDGTIQKLCARKFNTFWDWVRLLLINRGTKYFYKDYEYSINQPVECISGACLVLRRDILLDGRIFDPVFFMYGEDVDLCYTTYHRGWIIFYMSTAHVLHYGGESSKQEENIIDYDIEATLFLVNKRYGKLTSYTYRFFCLASTLSKLALAFVVLLIPKFQHDIKWVKRKFAYIKIVRYALKPN